MHCFVINLDRVPERWEFTRRNFADIGIETERFSAVDAAKPGALDGAHYVPHRGDRWELTDSLVACFESHRRVWQLVVDRGLSHAAIFEDDVVVTSALPRVLQWLSAGNAEFDVAKLDTARRTLRLDAPVATVDVMEVRPSLSGAASAAAYVVTRNAAQWLLKWSDPFSDHTDDFVFRPRAGWRVLQIWPAVSAQVMFLRPDEQRALGISDGSLTGSERSSDKRINKPTASGPMWFRARKEIRRSARKLYNGLHGDRALLARGGIVGECPFDIDTVPSAGVSAKA
jgi:GR25 family glycosyltransferase involved in LPS biosynthesis